MAELDYAFLAEYAKVEAGKLTVVGASTTQAAINPDGGPLWRVQRWPLRLIQWLR